MDDTRQCHARSRSGQRCRRAAILGGTVCSMHGGKAPQVQAKAAERIKALVAPALDRIEQLIATGESEQVCLAAARDILDRAGFGAVHKAEVTHHDGGSDLDREIAGLMEAMAGLGESPAPVDTPNQIPSETSST